MTAATSSRTCVPLSWRAVSSAVLLLFLAGAGTAGAQGSGNLPVSVTVVRCCTIDTTAVASSPLVTNLPTGAASLPTGAQVSAPANQLVHVRCATTRVTSQPAAAMTRPAGSTAAAPLVMRPASASAQTLFIQF
jgi:hypothetical protein